MSIFYTEEMELFHLLNRGVEKRDVVLDDSDRLRFMHDLFILNEKEIVDPNHRFRGFQKSKQDREPLVTIHAFCLMKNHYHLLVSEIEDGGISAFMRKLNMGYAKYFNEKYERQASLWQGKYKKIHINRDAHFLYIPFYIHLNPLDFEFPEWRVGEVRDPARACEYLAHYRWSSYPDYMGKRNFPSIIDTELLRDILGDSQKQMKTIRDIISDSEMAHRASLLE